ncbi:MAG: hypothetical protein FJW30_30245, partial [Acidobacteria bacterium]|nr:hypothetical protein [Acidobacteriota bacterium]
MKILVGLVLTLPMMAQMTAEDRAHWFAKSTFGVRSLAVGGPFSAGWRTMRNRPVEWGRTPEGFAKRYGYRLINNSVTNGVEGVAGAAWGEDPRYHRLGAGGGGARLGNALKRTFVTNYDDGNGVNPVIETNRISHTCRLTVFPTQTAASPPQWSSVGEAEA